MILAAIDLGTNSIRLYICAVTNGQVKQLTRKTVITRLGEKVVKTKKLQPEAVQRTLKVLQAYKKELNKFQVENCLVVGTSALREADNSADFLVKAEEILGFKAQVISGEKEAELTFLGSTSELAGNHFLVIDIGGGSTELIYGTKKEIIFSTSLLLGCVSLAEMFLVSDPPAKSQLAQAEKFAKEVLASHLPQLKPNTKTIAVAGTPTSLVAIRDKIWPYQPEKVHGQTLTVEEINQLAKQLSSLPLNVRKKVVGLQPQRAEVIVSGTIILQAILSNLKISSIIVSERDILDGIVFSLLNLAQKP